MTTMRSTALVLTLVTLVEAMSLASGASAEDASEAPADENVARSGHEENKQDVKPPVIDPEPVDLGCITGDSCGQAKGIRLKPLSIPGLF